MQFQVDHHFLVGRRHVNSGTPCQDFALSGLLEGGAAYAIIADGCSSGRHTDMGARVLSFATAKAVQLQWNLTQKSSGSKAQQEIAAHREIQIEGVKSALGLALEDMLATCVYAFVSPQGGFIRVNGDGVLAYKMKSGEVFMTRYDWKGNAPAYPAYVSDDYRAYIKVQGGDVSAKALIAQSCRIGADGVQTDLPPVEISLGEGVLGFAANFTSEELGQIDYVAVFSDGVTQVEDRKWQDIVYALLFFKTSAGEFAKRRLIRVMKDAEKTGKGLIDDVAYAAIKISLPQPTEANADQEQQTS